MEFGLHAHCPHYCRIAADYDCKAHVQEFAAANPRNKGYRQIRGLCFLNNQKAQSSAPFEVLVAVVIMGFVLYMALQAFNFLQEQQCKAQIHEQIVQLKSAVQETLKGQSNKLVFQPPRCTKDENEMRMVVKSNRAICRQVCGTEDDQCLVFFYQSENFMDQLCFDETPTYTNFLGQSQCTNLGDDYVLVDFFEPADPISGNPQVIPRGTYTLQNKTGSGEGIPKICAFLYHKAS